MPIVDASDTAGVPVQGQLGSDNETHTSVLFFREMIDSILTCIFYVSGILLINATGAHSSQDHIQRESTNILGEYPVDSMHRSIAMSYRGDGYYLLS